MGKYWLGLTSYHWDYLHTLGYVMVGILLFDKINSSGFVKEVNHSDSSDSSDSHGLPWKKKETNLCKNNIVSLKCSDPLEL